MVHHVHFIIDKIGVEWRAVNGDSSNNLQQNSCMHWTIRMSHLALVFRNIGASKAPSVVRPFGPNGISKSAYPHIECAQRCLITVQNTFVRFCHIDCTVPSILIRTSILAGTITQLYRMYSTSYSVSNVPDTYANRMPVQMYICIVYIIM